MMMRKKKYFCMLLTVALTGLLAVTCMDVNDPFGDEIPKDVISVDEAKAFFEEQMMQMGAVDDTEKLQGFATEFTPKWNEAVISRLDGMASVDVPIIAGYLFWAILPAKPGPNAMKSAVQMPQKLVVVKDLQTGDMGAYVVSMIPDKKMKLNAMDFPNYGDYGNFSGRVVYSLPLSPAPVRVNYFREGVLTDAAAVFGLQDRPEEMQAAVNKMTELLAGIGLRRKVQMKLRSSNDELDGGWLPEVIITGTDTGNSDFWGDYWDHFWETGIIDPGTITIPFLPGGTGGGGDNHSGGGGGSGSGDSPPQAVILSCPTPVTIMNPYNLTVICIPQNVPVTQIRYEIKHTQSGSYTALYDGYPPSGMLAQKAGHFHIRAIVSGVVSNIIEVEVQYPDANTIKSNSVVSSAMSSVWEETKNAASSSGRSERGFWIYVNTNTMTYECGPTQVGNPVSGCVGTHASVAPGVPSQSISASPTTGGKYAVAHFHTHTPLTYCSDGERTTGPSEGDENTLSSSSYGIPGLVYDYSASSIRAGHNKNDPAHAYTFGPIRRATPQF